VKVIPPKVTLFVLTVTGALHREALGVPAFIPVPTFVIAPICTEAKVAELTGRDGPLMPDTIAAGLPRVEKLDKANPIDCPEIDTPFTIDAKSTKTAICFVPLTINNPEGLLKVTVPFVVTEADKPPITVLVSWSRRYTLFTEVLFETPVLCNTIPDTVPFPLNTRLAIVFLAEPATSTLFGCAVARETVTGPDTVETVVELVPVPVPVPVAGEPAGQALRTALVKANTFPVAGRLFADWNLITALFVAAPKYEVSFPAEPTPAVATVYPSEFRDF
jgi:hypothetical protein